MLQLKQLNMSRLHNIKTVYSVAKDLYGVDPDPDDFEDVVLAGWEMIANKHTRLYRFIGDTVNQELQLPCNVVDIESVHIPFPDAQMTSNTTDLIDTESVFIERYIDLWNHNHSPFYSKGKLLKYKEGDGVLYFDKDYKHVMVVYHGIIADEDGLPLINDKEEKALAAFVAWKEIYKEGLKTRNRNILAIAADIERREWLPKCNAARVSEHLTQNDMNDILDARFRCERKQYGKSLKPLV